MIARIRRPDPRQRKKNVRHRPRAHSETTKPNAPKGQSASGEAASGDVNQRQSLRPSPEPPNSVSPLDFDRLVRAMMVQATFGRSPMSIVNACTDWSGHLAASPALQMSLLQHATESGLSWWRYATLATRTGKDAPEACVRPRIVDKRFADPAWGSWPFNIIHQAFLLQQEWCERAAAAVPGVSSHNAQEMSFLMRQALDAWAPSNFPTTNPVVIRTAFETGGRNFWQGGLNLLDDLQRAFSGQPPFGAEAFRPGETVACTEGVVVYRNELMELIQYNPRTAAVYPEPVLIVPAWIMKYYILDLSQANSLVRHLVEAGFTVFMISWRNPRPEHRDFGIDDYLSSGVEAALSVVRSVRAEPVHAVGYCLGGTLLAMAAASVGKRGEPALKSITLLAAQTDFEDAGELTLFVDESEVTFLEDLMWRSGRLEARQMAGVFQSLRSNDLIWSRLVRDYLLGSRTPSSDLSAWSADATHMPYRMHSEYLRRMFLRNDFAAGRYVVNGTPVGIANIDAPMFVVATEWDHIAPWKSVYKIHLQADVSITFVLTTGGHNVGIVNPPEGSKREFRLATHAPDAQYVSPEKWLEMNEPVLGSWWPAWVEWLRASSSELTEPPLQLWFGTVGPADVAAPGRYVFDI
jgi:polyhydroxyalkanoate synthase subunit PhaC